MESFLEEQDPHGVVLQFPKALRTHFGNGSEEILMELLTHSLQGNHIYERYNTQLPVYVKDRHV